MSLSTAALLAPKTIEKAISQLDLPGTSLQTLFGWGLGGTNVARQAGRSFAYDVFNNANTVVHGHWGRFMDDNALTLSSYLASSAAVQTRYAWSASLQRFLYQFQAGGASGNLLDPSLKPTYADETNFGITQRLTKDSSLDVTGIWKQSHDIFEDSCVNGTCTAPEFRFWMTNNPAGQTNVLKQKYDGVVTKYEWHPTWGNLLASYTWAKSLGSVEYTQNAGTE